MPKSALSFDRITIAAPCDADWETMIGNDQVRFCEHCQLHVTNLSSMTQAQAMSLVAQSRGRLCVRYLQRANGEILMKQLPQKLHYISRRVTRVAAGAFSAALSVASAAAQTKPDPNSALRPGPPVVSATAQSPGTGTSDSQSKPETGEVRPLMGVMAMRRPQDPLTEAAAQNDVNAVRALIPLADDVNKWDEFQNMNPLSYAIEHHNQEMIGLLLAAGANANSIGKQGRTPLMSLNADATIELVHQLISAGADINATDESGATVLNHVARSCPFAVFTELVGLGARVDAKDQNGNTLLMSAVENEDAAILKFLLAAGADVQAKNNNGDNVLMAAVQAGNIQTLKLIVDAGGALTTEQKTLNEMLLHIADTDDPKLVKILIATGADVNAAADDGTTALMKAAQSGQLEALGILIDAGADIDAVDDDRWTALMHADDVDHVRILLDAGADMTRKNKDGETALRMAIQSDQKDIVRLLKSRGAPE
jgi:ankyrin repeat protein